MEKDSSMERLRSAYRRIEQLKSFYVHFGAYCVVNISLLIYWYFESFMPETFWRTTFLVATVISGFILAAHAIFLFGAHYLLPKSWEEKKFRKLMEKEE